MSFNVKVAGTWQPLVSVWVKVAGTWQQVSSAWVKVSGTWQQVFTSLSATVDSPTISSAGSGFAPCGDPGTTSAVTVTPSGGVAPYTYAWARVGGAADSGPYQANAATSASTSFEDVDSSVCFADVNSTETWRCTVTDDNSQTATVDVDVTLTWEDFDVTYPKQTVQLRPTRGFVSDVPAHETGPDYFTLMTNVINRGGFAQRVPGSRSVYETALGTAAPVQLMHGINTDLSGTNYWLLFEDDGTAWAVETSNATQIDNTLLAAVGNPYAFSSTLLNGVPVISNGSDEPVFWAGSLLANLTDWTASESCQFITAFKYHLFALDISGPGGTFTSKLKWSDAAAPGTIPSSWTPGANEAGDAELSDSPGGLLCAYPLRDNLMIYKPSSVYAATYVGGNNIFNFRKIQAASGALTRRSVCDVNGQHLVVTNGDIVLTDGSNLRSIGEARVKDWLFNQLDQDNYLNLFCSYNRRASEVIIGFPSSGHEFCDTALVYNVALDSFGVRSLDEVTHAPLGVVNDTVAANAWTDRTETWSAAVGAWGSSSVSTARASMVFIHTDEMHQQDVNDAETITAYLGKYSMHFGDSARVKFLRRIHIRTAANYGTLYVRAGGQMEPNDAITWSSEVPVTDPEQTVNCFAQGRYISVAVRSSGSDVWKLTGLDLEVEQRGYY